MQKSNKEILRDTAETMAEDYWLAVTNAPDAWGCACHPITGVEAHIIMRQMTAIFGKEVAYAAIDAAV